MTGMLYLVPTPIGNLSDISVRCRKTLEQADFIAAEDTRVTLKLLNYLEIKKPLVSYYEHNKLESGPKIVRRILDGETCVLVSDAGSPAISDPGEDLVRLCAEADIPVCAIPGPCAVITALSDGKILLRGFFVHQQKKPAGASGWSAAGAPDNGFLRSASQAACHTQGPCQCLRGRPARKPLPGADEAP